MSFEHRGWAVKVYRQSHNDYPPWVATAQQKIGNVVQMFNVEGQTAEEAAAKMRKRIEEGTS